LDRLDREIPHDHMAGEGGGQIPAAWTDAERRLRESAPKAAAAWKQELEAVFGGKSAPLSQPAQATPPTFPTNDFQSRSEPNFSSQTAGRIEARPGSQQPGSQPTEGSFKRW
jgi:hypothetical protein